MDPISESSYNLATIVQPIDSKSTETDYLSQYETKNLKNLLPQITASVISTVGHVIVGMALGFSAVLIPQLQAPDSDLKVSDSQASWIASSYVLVTPIGVLLGAYLMDTMGRINTLKISVVPSVLGWGMMAFAPSVNYIIAGRVFIGVGAALATSPAVVYLTEIARKDMRGSLLSLGPAYVSLGMVLIYLLGWLISWRLICHISAVALFVPFALLYLIPESPAWLMSKNRQRDAELALTYLHKHQPFITSKNQTFAQLALEQLRHEQHLKELEARETGTGGGAIWREFLKPTGWKPILILTFLFVCQQFSGIYIFLFYSISFFDEIGTNVNPYVASILIGVIRLVMSMVNTYMLKKCTRRALLMTSAAGMTCCMLVSGWTTRQIGVSGPGGLLQWLPIVFLLLYVVSSMIGLLAIPWTMTAELFPLKIRSLAHSIATSIVNLVMFAAVQNYLWMLEVLGGSSGLQFFFAGVSFVTIFYTWFFVPETHGKTLAEIEAYFGGVGKKEGGDLEGGRKESLLKSDKSEM